MAKEDVVYRGKGAPKRPITFGGVAAGQPETVHCDGRVCVVPRSLVARFESQQDIARALKAKTLVREKAESAEPPKTGGTAPATGGS